MFRHRSAAILLAALALLAGCQSLPPPERHQAPSSLKLDLPFVPQDDYQCGPAALKMALSGVGVSEKLDTLVSEVWLPERKGTLAMSLNNASRERGIMPYPVNNPDALFAELEQGSAVLVMQNLGLPRWPQWHFAVVIGYYDSGQQIILHSDTREATTMRWNRFIRTWARADYWAIVLATPDRLPASATPAGLFRHITPLPDTHEYWSQASVRFPDSGLLWFANGNSLWEHGDAEGSLQAFQRSTELEPQRAAAWTNLIYVLEQQGKKDAAIRARCDAIALGHRLDDNSMMQSGCDHPN